MSLTNLYGQEYALIPFKQTEESSKISVVATIHQKPNQFQIVFSLYDSEELVVLPLTKRSFPRTQGLWNETCFEFFVTDQKAHYAEGNFTLDFGWNLFWFNSYRETPLYEFPLTTTEGSEEQNPIRDIYLSGKKSQIVIDVPKVLIEKFEADQIKFSLTTVIKTKTGHTHYFALKHSDDRPNFHHRESFVRYE